ncbi:hypothetical protein EDB80DRAFT_743245 [Ilyonectria destructans]|nr:hypothetical protein EDB80DRAFT_743245 [Ilyonectria destructans]
MTPDQVGEPSTAGVPGVTTNRSSTSGQGEFRSRRRHHKSRAGCRQCKSRRVRCDENRPNCGNCIKREITCEYFDMRYSIANHRKSPPRILPRSHQTQNEVAISPIHSTQEYTRIASSGFISSQDLFSTSVRTRSERLLDLRLFHHYLEMTTRSTDFQVTWSFWIVEEAVQSPHVMDALLGFSAFHLRRYDKFDQSLREASHRFMARAIEHHREQLREGFNEKNATRSAAICALVSVHASVNNSYLVPEGGPRLPLHWFHSFQTGLRVVHMAQSFIQDSKLSRQFQGLTSLEQVMMQGTCNDKFNFLLEYPDTQGSLDEDSLPAYSQAVALLSSLYSDLQHAKPLFFFVAVPSRFVDLLAAKDPRALAILGYFFMVVKKGRQFWWIDGAPEHEFATIMTFLPSHWWPVMSWAMQEFEQREGEETRNH